MNPAKNIQQALDIISYFELVPSSRNATAYEDHSYRYQSDDMVVCLSPRRGDYHLYLLNEIGMFERVTQLPLDDLFFLVKEGYPAIAQ